jgi:membrane protein
VLLWVYYSAQVFLLGAEFTRAWAGLEGSKQDAPVGPRAEASAGRPAENAAAR